MKYTKEDNKRYALCGISKQSWLLKTRIADEDKQLLKKAGYDLLWVTGEGNTRYAILTGEGVTIKVPKNPNQIDRNSICTLINLSKRDPNANEINYIKEISHPNVISIIDTIQLKGKTATVEDMLFAESLEDFVEEHGPVQDMFKKVFEKVIDGQYYLNKEKQILHRDIKPSNIFFRNFNEIKIGDLQNAVYKKDASEEALPTRGGTLCTHPELLNSVIKGTKTKATDRTEAYALGITMYYSLTGKYPFKYNLARQENGREIEVGKEKIKVGLTKNNNPIEEITKEEHETELKKSLKEIPRKYRKMIYHCLSMDEQFKDYDISNIKNEFEEIHLPLYKKVMPKAGLLKGFQQDIGSLCRKLYGKQQHLSLSYKLSDK
jgi:serine/threonine protein kinase